MYLESHIFSLSTVLKNDTGPALQHIGTAKAYRQERSGL